MNSPPRGGQALTHVLLLRHGPTAWNAQGRIQGQTDVELSDEGRLRVARWRLPAECYGWRWYASPLRRAVETARLLGAGPSLDPRLSEMHWGEWEGWRWEALRASLGASLRENEARGLDFRPPGGESPREVMARVGTWFEEVGGRDEPAVAVAHKGIVRAALSLACDLPQARQGLRDEHAHCFSVDASGRVRVERLNIPLAPP